jgi:hypothetical protein
VSRSLLWQQAWQRLHHVRVESPWRRETAVLNPTHAKHSSDTESEYYTNLTTYLSHHDILFQRLINRLDAFYKFVHWLNNAVDWDVTPCRSCVNRRLGGTYRLHLQGRKLRERGTSVSQVAADCSAIADLHTFQFTAAHALGFSVFTSRLLATDLSTELALQITLKSSYHFLFNHPGTSELN